MHVPICDACAKVEPIANSQAALVNSSITFGYFFPKRPTQPSFLKTQHALPPTPPNTALAPVPVATIECLRANAPSNSGRVGSDEVDTDDP